MKKIIMLIKQHQFVLCKAIRQLEIKNKRSKLCKIDTNVIFRNIKASPMPEIPSFCCSILSTGLFHG